MTLFTHLLLALPPRALQVSPRDDQHEHGVVYCSAQEALQVSSTGHHQRLCPVAVPAAEAAAAAAAAVRLPGRPAFLQLVPDPPQARREQLSHGARRGSARTVGGVPGQEQRLVYRQPAHLFFYGQSIQPSLFKS